MASLRSWLVPFAGRYIAVQVRVNSPVISIWFVGCVKDT